MTAEATTTTSASPADIEHLARLGKRDVRVHDPSTMVRCGEEYWFFCTGEGVPSHRSRDLQTWNAGPPVLTEPPVWADEAVPGNKRLHYWAPDVMRVGERYLLYYSISTFGKNGSAIGLATNPTLNPDDPQFKWADQGIVTQTRNAESAWNAIDPAVARDADGGLWLSFGSFWGGIKLIQLNPSTGKRIAPGSPVYAIANTSAIEAPYIFPRDGWYWLFVNWGFCCRGVKSTYNMRVGRSRSITGPYLDREGNDMRYDGGTLLLDTDGPFIGPGHAGILEERGAYWLSMHFYDATVEGKSMLAIRRLGWDAEGWPIVL